MSGGGLLSGIHFLAPRSATPSPKTQASSFQLFCDNLPWHRWSPEIGQSVAQWLVQRNVGVAILQREIDGENEFCVPPSHRITPIRNERYGLQETDFEASGVFDLRLTPIRNASGRFGYSAQHLSRWEGDADGLVVSGGGSVTAMMSPPDVAGDRLRPKLLQLRTLSPNAHSIVSFNVTTLSHWLDAAIQSGTDSVMVRFDEVSCDGAQLACMIHDINAALTNKATGEKIPELGITPPSTAWTPDDAAKTIAMGVSMVSIDGWLIEAMEELDRLPPPSKYSVQPRAELETKVGRILTDHLDVVLDRFEGLCETITPGSPKQSLASFHAQLAQRLGIGHIAVPPAARGK